MRTVFVNDHMQHGYTYVCREPIGKHFHPDFAPHLTPKEMLELGVFGGLYMTDGKDEFPQSWFTHAKLSMDGKRHKELNFFQRACQSTTLPYGKQKGGFIRMTRVGGFSGIVATILVAGI
jgi:hypothetical protein